MKAKRRRQLYAAHCARKVVYRTITAAAAAARCADDGLQVYHCPIAREHYHVGHSQHGLEECAIHRVSAAA